MQALRRRRLRIPRSCEECRRRKVKCDRKDPCSHCLLTQQRCVYNVRRVPIAASLRTPDSSTHKPASQIITPQHVYETDLNQHLNVQQTLGLEESFNVASSAGACDDVQSPSSTRPSSPTSKANDSVTELGRRVQTLEHLLSIYAPGSKVGATPYSSPFSNPLSKTASDSSRDRKITLNKSRLFGQSHWTNSVHEFKKIAEFLNNQNRSSSENETTAHLKLAVHALLRQCKLVSQTMKPSRSVRLRPYPEPIALNRNSADRMARLYMSGFESAFRILHVPSFWTEYEEYWKDPADVIDMTRFKVQLVLAIGSGLCQESFEVETSHSTAHQWVYAAQDWLSSPTGKDRLSISGLQVQCLLILARQTLSIGGDLIWVAMGTLLHTAMQLGLHRDPKHFAKMTVLEAEVRRRLWATILEMTLQASLDAGMPPTISFDDFDTDPPSNIDDTDIDDSTETFVERPRSTVTDVSLQRFLFDCSRPRLDMLRHMNSIRSEMSDDEIQILSSKVSAACYECSAYVQKEHVVQGEVFRRNMADLLLRRFLLVLHRPSASRARETPLYYFSRKISLDSAMALLSPLPDEGFSHLMLRGGGLFRSRLIHTSLALASELLIEAEDHEKNALQGVSSNMEILLGAVEKARWQWIQRMQLGDANVRFHMKLSIALSQAKGAEAGTSLQQRMTQSAKDSLDMCYLTLKARSSLGSGLPSYDRNLSFSEETNPQDLSCRAFDFEEILQTADFNFGGSSISGGLVQ